MKHAAILFALLAMIQPLAAETSGIGLISPEEAKAAIENSDPAKRPLVLDTRGGYKDYFRGHLPTAHHINFDTLRGTDKGVPVQYLPEDLTRALLVRAGVDKDRPIILYAEGAELPNDEILSSSMVAFVLEKYGLKDIRIIDGGLPEYRKQFPLTQEYPDTPKGNLPKAKAMHPEIALDIETVLKLKDQEGYVLVDARPKNEYEGDDVIWLRKGHIPGALSFHWARLMESNNTHKFKDVETCKKELAVAGITPDKDVLVYCGTSREGSLLRFILRHHLGYPKVRLYEGSWKEYVSLKQYPTQTGPNPK